MAHSPGDRIARAGAPAMAGALFDRMFVLLPAQATTNYSVRGLLPQLIQDIVMVQAFSEAQKSNLLASFYPGCVSDLNQRSSASPLVPQV